MPTRNIAACARSHIVVLIMTTLSPAAACGICCHGSRMPAVAACHADQVSFPKRRPFRSQPLIPTAHQRPQILGQQHACRGKRVLAKAEKSDSTDKADSDSEAATAEEARIERLEKLTRQKRKAQPPQLRQRRSEEAKKPRKGRWREGQLFPEGWETMGILEKGWQLWAGDRGFLFWTAKLAFNAIFVLIGGWVLFRFVGPALGLYELTNSLTDVPLD